MAKLSANGRAEVARFVKDGKDEDGTEYRTTYVLCDDGWILRKHGFRYMGRLRSGTYKRWKRIKKGNTPASIIEAMRAWDGVVAKIIRPDLVNVPVRRK